MLASVIGLDVRRSLVQNDAQQRAVDFDVAPAVAVAEEAQFSELVHKETHTRACRAYHLRKHLLADFRYNRRGHAFLAKI
jgi:hypothetical protein